jgi:hypothetical protein
VSVRSFYAVFKRLKILNKCGKTDAVNRKRLIFFSRCKALPMAVLIRRREQKTLQALLEKPKPIPAMTTDAERECFYRLAKEGASKGAVVELGAWLGAGTAWIAAGVRDSGANAKAKVYDRFDAKANHAVKVKHWCENHGVDKVAVGTPFEQFKTNLGPLLQYVEPSKCEIGGIKWLNGPVSVLICDAPKRVREISSVLTTFRKALEPGSIMAWQDFCHFPSYEIPACLYRIRDHIEFVEAVVPGTTMVFRVKSQWMRDEVSPESLATSRWTFDEIMDAWSYWAEAAPAEKAALFSCGATMFMCDVGFPAEAVLMLAGVYGAHGPAIIKKWKYLKEARPDFLTRYHPLFAYLGSCGAL